MYRIYTTAKILIDFCFLNHRPAGYRHSLWAILALPEWSLLTPQPKSRSSFVSSVIVRQSTDTSIGDLGTPRIPFIQSQPKFIQFCVLGHRPARYRHFLWAILARPECLLPTPEPKCFSSFVSSVIVREEKTYLIGDLGTPRMPFIYTTQKFSSSFVSSVIVRQDTDTPYGRSLHAQNAMY